jgi:hypothetical protein
VDSPHQTADPPAVVVLFGRRRTLLFRGLLSPVVQGNGDVVGPPVEPRLITKTVGILRLGVDRAGPLSR